MPDVRPAHTHTAYAFRRLGKKFGRLVEVGTGRIDRDRDIVHVFMDRQPIGGYTGYVLLSPRGVTPEPPTSSAQRPGLPDDDDESEA